MTRTNHRLRSTRGSNNDEFYTANRMVSDELDRYSAETWRDRSVLLPCNDTDSAVWRVLSTRFERWGLRELVAVAYQPGGNGRVRVRDQGREHWRELSGDGDFRSPEVTELRDRADMIVTNPPFSLFRELWGWLKAGRTQFAVVGNVNAISYRQITGDLIDGFARLGPSIRTGNRDFYVPDHYPLTGTVHRTDSAGTPMVTVGGVRWFTTVQHGWEPESLRLNPDSGPFPRYVNCAAVNVDRVRDIPVDYGDVMGVPITFLDRWNSRQFRLVGDGYGDDGKYLRLPGRTPYYRLRIRAQ